MSHKVEALCLGCFRVQNWENGGKCHMISLNQRKTIVNSWVRCLENNQLVNTSGFPTVNFRK